MLWQVTQDFIVNCSSEKFGEKYSDSKNNLNRNETWWVLEDITKIWLEGLWSSFFFNILTLARISPSNIYLNLFGRAHFHWRSLEACNIAKRTCLSYVWTAIILWSYCSLFKSVHCKLQVLHLFQARNSKTIDCRFTLKRVRDMIIICSYS